MASSSLELVDGIDELLSINDTHDIDQSVVECTNCNLEPIDDIESELERACEESYIGTLFLVNS